TRCYRDWSSDVCSSDLFLQLRLVHFETDRIVDLGSEGVGRLLQRQPRGRRREEVAAMERRADRAQEVLLGCQLADLGLRFRSEEIGRASCREGGEGAGV